MFIALIPKKFAYTFINKIKHVVNTSIAKEINVLLKCFIKFFVLFNFTTLKRTLFMRKFTEIK